MDVFNALIRALDLVFDPTLALTRFAEDLHLRYAMITAASCSLLTWIPLPVSGLDLQPRTYSPMH